ncbi:MAG: VF530 family protein [Anaerolineales bacterium]|nr:VF530 family protein [Anaerolineales bacterium]
MTDFKSNDPLHGLTLEAILTQLVKQYGWRELAERIKIRCFYHEPSVKSSLKFLRRTPWARKEVEALYLQAVQSKKSGSS